MDLRTVIYLNVFCDLKVENLMFFCFGIYFYNMIPVNGLSNGMSLRYWYLNFW